MRGLGKGIHSFRKGMEEARDEITRPLEDKKSDDKPSDEPKA